MANALSGPEPGFSQKTLQTIIVDNYYPYTFLNQQGAPDGFSLELLQAVAKVMDLKIDVQVGAWDQARKALAGGQIDLLPMMAYSTARAQEFDFTDPHTISYDAVFVEKGHNQVKSISDLAGKTIIVMQNDAAHDYLLAQGVTPPEKLVLVDSLPEALRLLSLGKGDAALMPKLVGLLLIDKLGLKNLEQSPLVIDDYNRPFSIAVKKGNKALLDRLSEGLSLVKATGEYQQIHQKWFGVVEPPPITLKSVLQYLLLAMAVFFLVGLVLIVWSFSLKKLVLLRTKELEEEISERKQAVEALRASEARFRVLVEQAPDAVFLHEFGPIVEVNQQACRSLGYSKEELLQLSVFDFEVALQSEELQALWKQRDDIVTLYGAHRRRDGSVFPVEIRSGTLQYQGRKMRLSFVRDITARKLAEEDLQLKEKLLDSVSDSIFLHDLEGHILYINEAASRDRGYKKDELLAQPLSALIAPEFVGVRESILKDLLARGEIIFVSAQRRKDGSIIPVEIHARTIDHDGRTLILSAARDIAERQRAEKALRTSESFLNSIIDQSPYPLWISNDTGTLIRINRACLDLLHIAEEEVIGRYNILKDNIVEQQGLMPLVQRVFEKGESARFEIKYDSSLLEIEHLQLQNFTSIILESFIFPIKNSAGKVANAVIQHLDITERKLAEEALHKSESQLRASLREKEVLLKEVHHRVKNNMQIISTLLDLQLQHSNGQSPAEIFQDCQSRIRSMALIHESLYQNDTLASIEFRQYLEHLTNRLLGLYVTGPKSIRAIVTGQDVDVDLYKAVPLGLIANELIINSLKHAFPGERPGDIRITTLLEGEHRVLEFKDNGIGLSREINLDTPQTFGWLMISNLVKQIDGTLELSGMGGTTCKIVF